RVHALSLPEIGRAAQREGELPKATTTRRAATRRRRLRRSEPRRVIIEPLLSLLVRARLEQAQLPALVRRPAKRRGRAFLFFGHVHFARAEAETTRGLIEEQAHRLDVGAVTLHAAPEARVVQLAAAHFAHASQHLFRGQRQRLAQALDEHGLDTAREPKRNHGGADRARGL